MDRSQLLLVLMAGAGLALLALAFLAGYAYCERQAQRRLRQRRFSLAVHEAGHAVLAWKSTLNLKVLWVAAPVQHAKRIGEVCYQPLSEHLGPAHRLDSAIVHLAGRAAEELICGSRRQGSGRTDREKAEALVRQVTENSRHSYDFLLNRVREKCASLVRKHRAEIEMIAQALLERRYLEQDDLFRLLGPRPRYS